MKGADSVCKCYGLLKEAVLQACMAKTLNVDFASDKLLLVGEALSFLNHFALFSNKGFSGEDKVLCAFSIPC